MEDGQYVVCNQSMKTLYGITIFLIKHKIENNNGRGRYYSELDFLFPFGFFFKILLTLQSFKAIYIEKNITNDASVIGDCRESFSSLSKIVFHLESFLRAFR